MIFQRRIIKILKNTYHIKKKKEKEIVKQHLKAVKYHQCNTSNDHYAHWFSYLLVYYKL